MGNSSSSASIGKPLAPETTVPKLLPTQSPVHKRLSLLENDKDFLDILFGEPSSRKSIDESKSKGSNESIKGENSANHEDEDEDNDEATSRPETDPPASQKRIPIKMRVRKWALPKRRRSPKTKPSPNPRAASLIWVTRAAERPSLPVPSPAVLSRVLLQLVPWLCHRNLHQVCPRRLLPEHHHQMVLPTFLARLRPQFLPMRPV
jgi:hypothetical protein